MSAISICSALQKRCPGVLHWKEIKDERQLNLLYYVLKYVTWGMYSVFALFRKGLGLHTLCTNIEVNRFWSNTLDLPG